MFNRKNYDKKRYIKYKIERKKYHAEYYIKHKLEISEHQKKYQQKNKEKIKKYMKKYRKNHIIKSNKYRKNRRKADIYFRLICNLRTRINEILKGNPKLSTTMNLVGCSIDKLKKHLESQFESGMSWNNYGYYGWHVDHIRPCVSFDLSKESEQKKCFNYKNLQPLWAKDNLSKNKK